MKIVEKPKFTHIPLFPDREPFPAKNHDHRRCVARAVLEAEEICSKKEVRLTPIRRRVLELVWESHAPVGAYDILERMNAEGRRTAPITVYRALDFLLDHRLIHRIASRNAFAGCGFPGTPHGAHFLICNECGAVAELHDTAIDRAIQAGAAEAGFAVDDPVVEIQGTCPDCQKASA
jgi:Fur family zinc uptake transcriptional regulator